MKIRSLLIASALAWQAPASDAAAQEQTPRGRTLEECVQLALQNNPDLRRSGSEIARAGTYKQQAFGQFLPSLSASAGWTRTDKDRYSLLPSGLITSRNSYDYSISSSLVLFDGLNNIYGADRGILNARAAESGHQRRRQDVIFLVKQGFYNSLRLQQLVKVNESNLERSRKQLERVRAMNQVGSVPLADVYRQQVQVGRDELGLLQSENDFRNSLVDMQTMLGLDPRSPFDIDAAGLAESVDSAGMARYRTELSDYPELVRRALDARSDYRQTEFALRSAEKGVGIARSAVFPTVSAFARYGWNNIVLEEFTSSGFTDFSYGLRISLPIFSNFNVSTAIERAEIDRSDAATYLSEQERAIASGVQKSLNTLAAAEKNVEISTRTLRSALEDQRIATERYSIGAGTLLDLIVANANLTAAQSDVVNATFNYLTARAQVEYQLGILSD